jgi:hypothetical protein
MISTQKGPAMNIDIATCAFWKGTGIVTVMTEVKMLYLFMAYVQEFTHLKLMGLRRAEEYKSNSTASTKLRSLKTLRVMVKHGPREMKYGITSMSREGAKTLSFDYQGKQITVYRYFQQVNCIHHDCDSLTPQ